MTTKYPGSILTDGAATSYSVAFDGTGDYLSVADNSALQMGSSDFTIEFWVNFSSFTNYSTVFEKGYISSGGLLIQRDTGTGTILIYASGSVVITASSSSLIGSWDHYALVRSGTTLSLYKNGISVGSTSNSTNFNNTGTAYIGGSTGGGGYYTNGYISNLRIVKGTAVYTSNFNVPTQLANITNTSLLTCQQPTIVDASSNNFAITVAGDAKVSSFTPFPAYQAYNPALGGGTNGLWTLNQAAYAAQNQSWNMYDPYWNYTTLLLNGESAANGAQNNTFLDSSTNSFTITRNGNTTQGTFSPYGSLWSNYFDGSGDYISVPDNTAFDVGAGDFTIEFWVNPDSTPASGQYICGQSDSGTSTGSVALFVYRDSANKIVGRFQATDAEYYGNASTGTAPNGVWTHVAYTRSGNTTYLFLNGILNATTDVTGKTVTNSSAIFSVGRIGASSNYQFPGYVSNFRFIKGTAVYTSNFTPSTTPLTAITNTSLLTCQSNRFIDNSSNAFAITVAGDTKVTRFSPFNPTAPYSASTIGGSGYFDGTGDYLSVADNAAFQFGSSDFTIGCWVYPISIANNPFICARYNAGSNQREFYFEIVADGSVFLRASSNGSTYTDYQTSAGLVKVNQWNYITLSKTGSTAYIGVNGVVSSGSTVSTYYSASQPLYIADAYYVSAPLNGYMCDFRVIKGTAVYTSNFTPPSSPVTAITNTSLLCNFTNAGIPDLAMQNDLETVGNAQISTSVKKYGTGSLAFDGTGDYLKYLPAAGSQAFGTGDFTIECWINFGSVSSSVIVGNIDSSGYGDWAFFYNSASTVLRMLINNAAVTLSSSSWTPTSNTWYHVAITRASGTYRFFINGTVTGSGSDSTSITWTAANFSYVGSTNNGGLQLNGYIDDLRITKGYARYTANFTPPTSSLQNL